MPKMWQSIRTETKEKITWEIHKMKNLFKVLLLLIAAIIIVTPVSATSWTYTNGCWTATDGDYTIQMWNSTQTTSWTVPTGVSNVEYLIVGGGGGGASVASSGGGGAGGLLVNSTGGYSVTAGQSLTVIIGGGGAGGPGGGASTAGTNGTNSQFDTFIAYGGGGGGTYDGPGKAGGSGGGGGAGPSVTRELGGVGTSGQGNDGGLGGLNGANGGNWQGGGGGGAGEVGSNGRPTTNGDGGDGLQISITGEAKYYAGGGGGGADNTYNSAGGLGGGGAGYYSTQAGQAGTDGLGGGGGGGGNNGDVPPKAFAGGRGGNGTVIVRYISVSPPVSSFTVNSTTGVAPFGVQFTDTSFPTGSSWKWNATNISGNNVEYTFSTEQNPIASFTIKGDYYIKLISTNDVGTNISTQNTTLKVYPAYTKVFYNTTGSNTFKIPYGVNTISLLTVGGGGGGAAPSGGSGGGGGGAGGVVETHDYPVTPGETYDIYVGSGGQYGINNGAQTPTAGINSTFGNSTYTIVAYGGGGGTTTAVINGSSGGGGLTTHGYAIYGSQGHDGYPSGQTSSPYTAGGGGGAGVASISRMGGNGTLIYWLSSTPFYIGGGGSGGSYATSGLYAGGLGGGGNGIQNAHGYNGTDNLGGGGGGTGGTNTVHGGKGGDGTVIVAYEALPLLSMFTTNYTSPLVSPPYHDIQFTDLSEGTPTSWSWSFNDVVGNNTPVVFSTTQNPIHTFGVGNYSISLNASTVTGYSISSQTTFINISQLTDVPIVSFTSTTATGIVPLTVAYTDTSTNYPTSWSWNFTDGGTGIDSTLQNPTHTYNAAGTYSVNFTATSSAGSNSTIATNYVTVNPMVATATANTTYGIAPLPVQFNGTSTGSPNTYYWDFGDGQTSTEQNVTHTYNTIGVFDVGFKATNTSSGAFDWDNHTSYIQSTGVAPVSDFSGTPTSGVVPLNVVFTDASQNTPDTWLWDFGDGYTSTLQNPAHLYNVTGTYDVNLTTTNVMGSNSMVKSGYVTVTPMVVTFSSNNTIGSDHVDAQFTASSTGSPNTWYWDLGDGNTSTLQNPFHQYTGIGNYDVAAKATNTSSGAYSWTNKTGYISVTGLQTPVASFSMSLTNSYVPMTVTFTDTSTNTPSSWLWNFGDGNTSVSQNPVFVYNVPGTYEVNLTATNVIGSNTSTFKYLIATAVPLAPQANFSWSNIQGIILPVTVQFTDLSSQSPTSWYWSDFGDGSGQTSLLQNPTHVYNSVGAFPVTLSVTNINGTPSQITKYVQITSTTGGVTDTITTVGSTTVETLSGNGGYAWTCPSGVYSVNTLLIGGGAAGTNGGTVTGKTNTWVSSGGAKGQEVVQSTITVTPGQTYQFVVGAGGVSGSTALSYTSSGGIWNLTRGGVPYKSWTDVGEVTTLITDPLSGGSTYAFGYTAAGGTNGLQYITPYYETLTYATGSIFTTAVNGGTYSTSGNYVTYGGSGGGPGYVGGTTGGGNGYGYLGGPSTDGTFYGSGGGAGDNTGGSTDNGGAGENGVIIINYQIAPVIIPPVANFTATPLSGAAPLSVQFTDTSSNGPTSWAWTFGDGGTSTEKNPLHIYYADGSYTVTLTDYNLNTTGYGTVVKTNYINVSTTVTPTPTPAPQSSTVWFVPKTVQFIIVDNYGNIVPGAIVNGHFISSGALPGGLQDLITYYGMNEQAANSAVNGTLIMNTTADSNGQAVLTMLQTLTYNVTVSYGEINNVYTINPQDSMYQLKLVTPTTTRTDEYECVLSNGNTWTGAYSNIKDDAYNITLMFSYQDTCGLTDSITYYVYDKGTEAAPTDVLAYTTTVSPVTTNIYKLNVTVANTRGQNYLWYENYTRSV
jgi:PKD repeat protein